MNRKYFAYISTCVILAFASLQVMAQKTIYVLSDLHVMSPDLLIEDGSAWQAYLEDDRKMVDYSYPIFNALLDKIESALPDLVLITGDLTKDGEVLSHECVMNGLNRLKKADITTLVIPGNHDFGTDFACFYKGSTKWAADVLDIKGYKEMYKGIGYFDHNSPAQKLFSDLSYWQEPIEGLIVIGLDSHTGSISEGDVTEACRRIKWARHDGYEVIVMMHHALIPHFYKESSYMTDALVKNNEEIKNKLLEAGAHIVLSGHFHTSDIARDFNTDMSESIVDINTGSPISYPCDYRVLTFDPESKAINVKTESLTELTGVNSFPTMAKQRLFESSKKTAARYLTNLINYYAPSMSSLLSDYLPTWSEGLAKAFVLFAEGNEPEADEKEKESIKKDLKTPMLLVPETGYMLNSLLEDKTPYDPEGNDPHMNVTDDRTLEIPHEYITIDMGTPDKETILLQDPEVPSAATLYYSDKNLVVPEDIQVSTLKMGEQGDKKTVGQSKVYASGDVIPAGTAVIVQSVMTPATYCKETGLDIEDMLNRSAELGIPSPNKCTFKITDQEGDADEDNVLLGFDSESMTIGPDNSDNFKFYKLCWAKEPDASKETLGFYDSEANGAAFLSGAHKAYLAIPADSAADSYTFDDLTGIKEVKTMQSNNKIIYTISGVRMPESKTLPRCIFITNGRKMIVK